MQHPLLQHRARVTDSSTKLYADAPDSWRWLVCCCDREVDGGGDEDENSMTPGGRRQTLRIQSRLVGLSMPVRDESC